MITGKQIGEQAAGLLLLPTIPYTLGGEITEGMDCQGLVEWTLRELGMKVDYRGTNDMWRTMLSDKGTIAEGVSRYGVLPNGALIFIVDHDGGEPARYLSDGEGNAWHVYVKIADDLLIHASASHLEVCTRSFAGKAISGGPSHYGLIDGVDYGTGEQSAAGVSLQQAWKPRYAHLRFRKGDRGGGTREIQTALHLCGYTLAVDGEFGPLTEQAVIGFQSKHGLVPDGIVGKYTWHALVKAANQTDETEG